MSPLIRALIGVLVILVSLGFIMFRGIIWLKQDQEEDLSHKDQERDEIWKTKEK